MVEILLTFVVLLMIVGAMSVGVLMGRKPITGSCGGLANAGVGGPCEICGGDMSKCDAEIQDESIPRSRMSADSPIYVNAADTRT